MKKVFTVTIETDDDNIREKYNNFRYNWNEPKDFIDHLAREIATDPAWWADYGYRVTVTPKRVK